MDLLAPDSDSLVPKIVARNGRRARRALEALRRSARLRRRRQACDALEAALDALRGARRAAVLWSPEMRAWLAAAEEAVALAAAADAGDRELFERVARGPHLATVLPGGRLDGGFRRRAAALGRRLVDRVLRRLPPLLFLITPPGRSFGPFRLDLQADAEEARRAGELHTAFPVPWSWSVGGEARLWLDGDEARLEVGRSRLRGAPRPVLPGSSIVLARRAVAGRRGLRPGAMVRGLDERLGTALELVARAWPAARREIEIHTRVVVPVEETGVVSYSLPDRPGTSYINCTGKRLVDLADDLVHETAHHRLHSQEELTPLERRGADAAYYSPWRRQVRPLHGILHASYTFTFRAELFARLARLPGRLPRAWMRAEIGRERRMLRQTLHCLRDAESRSLLTAAGSRIVDDIARHVRGLP